MFLTQSTSIRRAFVLSATVCISSCASAAESLNPTPDLTPYTSFSIHSSGAASNFQQLSGATSFNRGSSVISLSASNGQIGQLTVQPEQCRDDDRLECQRRFTAAGQIAAFDTQINCYIQIRNDTEIGYQKQPLSGICQDRYNRSFAITIQGSSSK